MKSATVKRSVDLSINTVKANYIKMIELLDAHDDSMSFLSVLNMSDPLIADAVRSVYPPIDDF